MWDKIQKQPSNFKARPGFTIVELLIVIVVIGILAAITVVAYNGIQEKARWTQATAAASQVAKKVQLSYVENGVYPLNLADIGISNPSGILYTYTKTDDWFCVAATSSSASTVVAGYGSNGNCAQLSVSYYNNGTLTGSPVLTRIEQNVDYDWGGDSPGPGVTDNNFSAVWSGYITAPTTDTYTLYLYYDDRFRLYLDDVLVADHWSLGCCTWRSIDYAFTASRQIPFKIEMAEGAGGAAARIHWSYSGQGKIAIPASAFSSK